MRKITHHAALEPWCPHAYVRAAAAPLRRARSVMVRHIANRVAVMYLRRIVELGGVSQVLTIRCTRTPKVQGIHRGFPSPCAWGSVYPQPDIDRRTACYFPEEIRVF
ncbi:hypothetical protein [Cutibacterium modestum]|uniref:hypothetical protein n=1 Tax=Cutibacterium modestum TaxID=2559073 RepID=UPI00192E08E0|nr:hypothetical protein [Cutibacterium modestum]